MDDYRRGLGMYINNNKMVTLIKKPKIIPDHNKLITVKIFLDSEKVLIRRPDDHSK